MCSSEGLIVFRPDGPTLARFEDVAGYAHIRVQVGTQLS
ncbi:hypothetical protein SCYAM73S_07298 [Streptomyces cyaneofuscatus]